MPHRRRWTIVAAIAVVVGAVITVLVGTWGSSPTTRPCPPAEPSCADQASSAAPDPGGDENDNVPIPAPNGKTFGFSSFLYAWPAPGGQTVATETRWARAVHATVHRFQLLWRQLQPRETDDPLPAPGSPTYPKLEKHLKMYDALVHPPRGVASITPIITVMGAPFWATKWPATNCAGNFACIRDKRLAMQPVSNNVPPDDGHRDAWRAFVKAVAEKFPKAVIEVWNEPNHEFGWRPDPPDPVLMARLQCDAYEVVKEVTPPNTVLSSAFGTADVPGSPTYESYLGEMYKDTTGSADSAKRHKSLTACMDGLSIHLYPGDDGELGKNSAFAQRFKSVTDTRAAADPPDDSRIWVSETGLSTYTNRGTGDVVTEQEQCSTDLRLYNKLMTMPGIQSVVFYTLRDHPTPGELPPNTDPTTIAGWNFGFRKDDAHRSAKQVYNAFVAKAAGRTPRCGV